MSATISCVISRHTERERQVNKAFLLDRDGTINVDSGYVGDPEKLVLLPGAAQAIRKINDAGYLAIVISNQSGVARGYFTMQDVDKVNRRLNELLGEAGAHIDRFYSCPHLKGAPVKEYDVDCDCRKPGTGLFRRAIEENRLDPAVCYACGDKERDVERLSELGIPESQTVVLKRDDGLLQFVEEVLR